MPQTLKQLKINIRLYKAEMRKSNQKLEKTKSRATKNPEIDT